MELVFPLYFIHPITGGMLCTRIGGQLHCSPVAFHGLIKVLRTVMGLSNFSTLVTTIDFTRWGKGQINLAIDHLMTIYWAIPIPYCSDSIYIS
jgi:hypothetical protein